MNPATSLSLVWNKAVLGVQAEQAWVLSAMQAHGPSLVALLWRILGNEQDVCDAYQDTFVHLIQINNGHEPRHIKAYVFRTATHVAVNILRRKKSFQKACEELSCRQSEAAASATDLDAANLSDRLRQFIMRLPEHQRDVILLRDLGELSYQQVAQTLGISPGSARVFRCRAVQLLARWMARDCE